MKAVRVLPMMFATLLLLSVLTDAQFYLPSRFGGLNRWKGYFYRIPVSQKITTNNYCSNVCNTDPICIVNCNYFTSGSSLPLPVTTSTTPTTDTATSSTASTANPTTASTPSTTSTPTTTLTPTTTTASTTTTPATTTSPSTTTSTLTTTTPATTTTPSTTTSTPTTTTASTTTTPATTTTSSTTTASTTATTTTSRPTPPPNPSVTTCEGKPLVIKCPVSTNQTQIAVLEARYGRYDKDVCPGANQQNTNCDKDVTAILRNICGNKINCAFLPTNDHFGDPCPGTSKYLKMEYKCV